MFQPGKEKAKEIAGDRQVSAVKSLWLLLQTLNYSPYLSSGIKDHLLQEYRSYIKLAFHTNFFLAFSNSKLLSSHVGDAAAPRLSLKSCSAEKTKTILAWYPKDVLLRKLYTFCGFIDRELSFFFLYWLGSLDCMVIEEVISFQYFILKFLHYCF